MGKLNLVIEDAPQKASKWEEEYKEISEAFSGLSIGKSFVIENSIVPSLGLATKIREIVQLKEGEGVKISRIKNDAGKLTGIRIIKTESQGETQES